MKKAPKTETFFKIVMIIIRKSSIFAVFQRILHIRFGSIQRTFQIYDEGGVVMRMTLEQLYYITSIMNNIAILLMMCLKN